MASAGLSILSLLTDVKCALCNNQIGTPHVLSCVHSLCKKCFERYLKGNNTLGKIICPLCLEETVVKDAQFPDLRHDIRSMTLIERLEKAETRKQDEKMVTNTCQVCGETDSGRASSKIHCSGCGNMQTHHTSTEVPPLVRPTLLQAEDDQNMEIYCKMHEGKKKDLFCIVCLTPVCNECSATDHCPQDNHECVQIENYTPTMHKELQARLSGLPDVYEQWENIILEIKNMEGFLKKQRDALNKKIETDICQFTKRVKSTLITKNKNFFQFRNQTLKLLRREVEARVEEIEKRQIQTKYILEQSEDHSLAVIYRELRDSLEILLSDTPDQSKLKAINRASKLDFQLNIDVGRVGSLLSPCHERKDIKLNETRGGGAVTFTRDGRVAFADSYYIDQTTTAYKMAFQFGMRINHSASTDSPLASLSDLRFVMAKNGSGFTRRAHGDVYYVTELPGSISSIVTDLEDNIYCSVPSCKRIYVIRTDETPMKSIPTGNLIPQHIAVCPHSPDQIMFTHDSSKISVVDWSGNLLRTITRPEWKDVAIGCDGGKLMYVLWKNEAEMRTLQRFYLNGDLFDTLFEGETHGWYKLLLAVSPDGAAAFVTEKGSFVTLVSAARSLPKNIEVSRP